MMGRILSLVSRIYALGLLAFPARHRETYRADMLDTFAREATERRQRFGAFPAFRFAIAASLNAVSAGLGERRRDRSHRSTGDRFSFAAIGPDLIQATRALRKAKAFSFVSIMSLGIGIGTVTAIVVFLRVVSGPALMINPKGLVELLITPQGELRDKAGDVAVERWSYPDFAEVRDSPTGMAITGWTLDETVVELPTGASNRVRALYASPTYFKAVGVTLARGREFEPADDARAVVILSHALWKNTLGADPDIIGKSLIVDGVSRVVVGLAPEGFQRHLGSMSMPSIQLFVPLEQHPRLSGPDSLRNNREFDWVHLLGQLSDGTSIAQANAAVSSVMAGIAGRYPATNRLKLASVEPFSPLGAMKASVIVRVRASLLGLSGAVLLVVCLNISGMVMVRSARRERELAVRLAMGASRFRLIQYLLAESLVLSFLGGGLSAAVLFGAPAVVTWAYGVPLPDPRLRPDALMMLSGVILCFVTSLIFGLLPALRFSRPTLVTTLKDETGGGGHRVGRAHRITTAIQAAIAIPFLAFSAAKIDHVRTTATADLGFKTAGLFALPVELDKQLSMTDARQHLESGSGVQSVTIADSLPLDFRTSGIEVRVTREGQSGQWAHVTRVDTRYLETMGIRLLSGRFITSEDRSGGIPVTVLSEPLAHLMFPEGNALGQELKIALDDGPPKSMTVVGVSADVVTSQMGVSRAQLYVPLSQHPTDQVILIARASASRESAQAIFQQALPRLDPNQLKARFLTGEDLIATSMWDLFSHSALAGVCGLVALSLTALGVFGVVGFMVATRTREIGVRIALGASRLRVLGMVLVDTVRLVVPGVLIGLAPAVWIVREDSYYELGLAEPLIYTFAAAVTLGAALISALPSARRAARVEPIIAMKSE